MPDFDTTITILSAATAIPLLLTAALMISRRNKTAADYYVIVFTVAMASFFVLLWLRRVIEWPTWVAIAYFLVSTASSWGIFFWVVRSIRRGAYDR